jgi:hypothetical protein
MRGPIQIEFDTPSARWIGMTVRCHDQEVTVIGSSTPYDSIGDLAMAMFRLAAGSPDAVVSFNEEPMEYDLRFQERDNRIDVTLTIYPDHRRSKDIGRDVLRAEASRAEVCLSFWRALRRLQTALSEEGFAEAWGYPFPARTVDRLTQLIRDLNEDHHGKRRFFID